MDREWVMVVGSTLAPGFSQWALRFSCKELGRGVALPFLWTFYDAPFKERCETYFSLLQYYVDNFSLFLREAACLPVYNVGRFDVLLV